MVLASHVILSTYGFWLPNDPRGSWSEFVGSWELWRFGRATRTDSRQSVAHHPHDRRLRQAARQSLRYPPVRWSTIQSQAVGQAFGTIVGQYKLLAWGCAILPKHVHLILGRHTLPVERQVNLLKGEASRALLRTGCHPLAKFADQTGRPPGMWARGMWKVFLDSPQTVARAIDYVEQNPVKEGQPKQTWDFVTPVEI